MVHTEACKCAVCQAQRVPSEAPLLATRYATKTMVMTAVAVEFSGRSWIVYYRLGNVAVGITSVGSGTKWMPLHVWNKAVTTWQKYWEERRQK